MFNNNQEQEIATIQPRSLTLNLSDADVDRVHQLAGSHGLSVGQLLENFIGDLVNGTYTNGSDERDLAQGWFNRCWFGMFPENTFLRYMLNGSDISIDNLLYYYKELKTTEEGIAKTEKELVDGVIKGHSGVFHWYDIVNSDGKQSYSTIDEWREEEREFLAQEREQAQWYKEELEDCWKGFLDWRAMENEPDTGDLELSTEIEKIISWKKNTEQELKKQEKVAVKKAPVVAPKL